MARGAADHAAPPLSSRERAGAYGARILFLGAMAPFWFFTTQFLQNVLGFSPLAAGIAFLPTTLPNFASAVAVPKLARRFGMARVLAAGLVVGLVGMVWLGQVSADTSYVIGVALPMILIGVGQGAVLGPLTAFGVAGVSARDAGAASGLVNAAHQLGGSVGLAVLVTVFAATGTGDLDGRVVLAHRISAGNHRRRGDARDGAHCRDRADRPAQADRASRGAGIERVTIVSNKNTRKKNNGNQASGFAALSEGAS